MKIQSWSHRRRVITLESKSVAFDENGITECEAGMGEVIMRYVDDALVIDDAPKAVPPKPAPPPIVKFKAGTTAKAIDPAAPEETRDGFPFVDGEGDDPDTQAVLTAPEKQPPRINLGA